MKRIFIIIIALYSTLCAKAQDEMVFSHYIMNPVLINPAASGFNDKHNFFLHYKNQWTGFTGAPRTIAGSYNGTLGSKLGIGAFISQENISYTSRFRGLLSYAFRFKMNEFKGSLGLSTEFKSMTLSNELLGNSLYQQGDNVANIALAGENFFDATMGFYGVYADKLTVSVAMPNMIQARLSQIAGQSDTKGGLRYFNVSFGYREQVGDLKIEPSILLQKMMDAPLRIDLNLKGSFLDDKVIGALSYRAGTGGGLGVMVGTKFNGLTFAYTYDYGLQRFQQYSTGAHEITLGVSLNKKAKAMPETPVEESTSFIERNFSN
jgi:type IX secretion system PorP/SprF family membrane protein